MSNANVVPLTPAPPEVDVRTEARAHLRALMYDAVQALAALDTGDFLSADSALKAAMLAAGDGRAALQVALVPPPKVQVDEALKEWSFT